MIIPIKGQPVALRENGQPDFNERNACTRDSQTYCQPVAEGMITQFQVILGKANGTQLVVNPDFTTDLSSWTTVNVSHSPDYSGSAFINALSGTSYMTQAVAVEANSYYSLEIKIRNFVANTGGAAIGQSGSFTDPTGYTQHTVGTDRILRSWGKSGALTSILIYIAGSNASFYVESVKVYKLVIPLAEVRTCDDDKVLDADVRLFEDRGIITVNWKDVAEASEADCFKICVFPDGDQAVNHLACYNAIIDDDGEMFIDNLGECIISGE